MCLTFLFIIVLQTTIIIGGPQSKPEQFLVKVLDDRYLRSPVMILVEGCSKTVYRFEHICSKINQLPNDVTLAIATYNSSGLGPTIEAAGIYEIQNDIMNYLKISTHRIRCKPEFGVFTAIRQAADVIPYDSEIVLITSQPPSDPELQLTTLQTLIQKRCKLQVIWLEKSEVPGKYYESAQRTGGEVYEVDEYEWPFDKPTNNKSEELKVHNTTEEFFNEDLFNPPQKVMIAVKRGVQDILSLPILVDSSMSEIYITTTGSVHKASLRLPNGLLKELSTGNTTIISTDKQLGVWQLEAVGHNFNVTVQALSHLKYSAFVEQRNITAPDNSGKNVGLVRLHGEGKLDEVVLVDEMGKELTKFEQVQNSYEDEENKKIEDHSSDSTDNDSISEWQIPADQLQNKHYYIQVVGQDSRGDKFTRLSSIRVGNNNLQQPVTVELNELSQIIATPGQTINLYYDVANNYYQPIDMIFYTQDNLNFIRDIVPKRQVVLPQTKIQVNVILEIQTTSSQTTDVVTMTAQSYLGPITAKTYLYIGYQRTDSDRPSISYTTDGYCRDTLSPSVCYSNWWSVDAVIQDDSGLIRVQSLPNGLQYKSEFIAGTKDKVYVHYTSNCCNTKVDIIASDVNGNVRTRTIDIERVWLTAGEITAIVLGVLLAILIIILIIVLICICVRRRRNRNFLMHQ